jgi:hypothetical protein
MKNKHVSYFKRCRMYGCGREKVDGWALCERCLRHHRQSGLSIEKVREEKSEGSDGRKE